jgi:hypothetical protein
MAKTSIKLKFRPSLIEGCEGVLYFQIIRNRIARQLTTDYRVFESEWNASKSAIVDGCDINRNIILSGIRESVRRDIGRLNRIVNNFNESGNDCTADEIITEFQRVSREYTVFNFMQSVIMHLQQRAVSVEEIKRIKSLNLPSNTSLSLARDLFMFSFYTRGMAFVDMAHLRHRDIQCGYIVYHRHKTGQLMNIKIEKCMQEIIDRYRNADSCYVFPILKTPGHEYREYKNALRLVNVKSISHRLILPSLIKPIFKY